METIKFLNDLFGGITVVVTENNEPLFYAMDVCRALGYSDAKAEIRDHVEKEDKIMIKKTDLKVGKTPTFKIWKDKTDRNAKPFLNEAGLYSLVLSCKLPQAKEFKRWITHEVLPSIRKNGAYVVGQEEAGDPDGVAKKAFESVRDTVADTKAMSEWQHWKETWEAQFEAEYVCNKDGVLVLKTLL